jgi:hypothetical protein
VIRITLDVNVLASGFPAETGPPAALIDAWTNLGFELIISEHILEGLERTWQKPYYQRTFTAEQVHDSLTVLRTEATFVGSASKFCAADRHERRVGAATGEPARFSADLMPTGAQGTIDKRPRKSASNRQTQNFDAHPRL